MHVWLQRMKPDLLLPRNRTPIAACGGAVEPAGLAAFVAPFADPCDVREDVPDLLRRSGCRHLLAAAKARLERYTNWLTQTLITALRD